MLSSAFKTAVSSVELLPGGGEGRGGGAVCGASRIPASKRQQDAAEGEVEPRAGLSTRLYGNTDVGSHPEPVLNWVNWLLNVKCDQRSLLKTRFLHPQCYSALASFPMPCPHVSTKTQTCGGVILTPRQAAQRLS